MANEKKDEGPSKLSPPTIRVEPKKTGSVFGWARNTYFYFFIALAFASMLSSSSSAYQQAVEIWTSVEKKGSDEEVKDENRSLVSQPSCNTCETCVELNVGQTRTRISVAETFPGYRGAVRICHQGNTFRAFTNKKGREVEETFGPQEEAPFTSEDWKEFYLVGEPGTSVSICKKCNN